MKIGRVVPVIFLAAMIAISVVECGNEATLGEPLWQFEETLSELISATTGVADVALGDLSTHGIHITVPGDALEQPTTIVLFHSETGASPRKLPGAHGKESTPA